MAPVQREINLRQPAWWLLLDGLLINAASALAWYIRYQLAWFRSVDPVFYTSLRAYAPLFAGLTVLLLVVPGHQADRLTPGVSTSSGS